MPQLDPSSAAAPIAMIEQGLAYIGILLGGIFGTHGFRKIREKRENGRNGKTDLGDVVAAIHASGEKIQQTTREESEKTRDELGKTRVVIREANKEELAVIRETSAAHLTAVTRAHDAQLALCQAQVVRAEKGLAVAEEMLRKKEI